jgi:hypothetical protein
MVHQPVSWRVSSHSGQASSCVAIRNDLNAVRDSKDRHGAVLHVPGLPILIQAVKSQR